MKRQTEGLLRVVKYQVFGGEKPSIRDEDVSDILREAKAQTVFLSAFPFLKGKLQKTDLSAYLRQQDFFLGEVICNTNNFMEHEELHRLMTENRIPYCTLKGMASAYYYPEASLRAMGDVDFLVREADFDRAKQAILRAGFSVDHGDDDSGKHIAFHRAPRSVWEQHRSFDTPESALGEQIAKEIDTVIDTAEQITLDGATCMIPDAYHHGLIMLLHVIAHLTSEGIGLRHLCDWAVFAEKLDSAEFKRLFESKLRRFGLWRFAQILTLVSEKYLGISHKAWAEQADISEAMLEAVMEDILSGGNFGKKDMNRYREIKYISNRGEGTVDNKNVLRQGIFTLNQKVYRDYHWIDKRRLFLPVGWIAEGGKYIGLLITGKRKNQNTAAMLKEASSRKELYSRMRLFEPE
ncbi:MAG: nucleotidyltransferase family protein [Ruminococcus sp.]|nr:nucleotidyltransferase family protein [Ruminococcus sp.]